MQGLAAAIGVEDLKIEPVLFEDSRSLSDVWQAAVPVVGRTHRKLEPIVATSRR